MTLCDRRLAMPGLISYRCKGRYGWIMIGAMTRAGALREAARSTDVAIANAGLEMWDGNKYIPAFELLTD